MCQSNSHEAKNKKSVRNKANYSLKITLFRKNTHTQFLVTSFAQLQERTTRIQMNKLFGQGGNLELMA